MATPLSEKQFPEEKTRVLSRTFVARRLHSLLGIWLSIYLFQHLLVNSQAALFFYDEGAAFITMVNRLEALPYLKVIEITILGLPFLLHGIWGIFYLRTAKMNSSQTDGSKPALPQYRKNRAYSWQRITSWLLLIGITAHVVHMRFLEAPTYVTKGTEGSYLLIQTKSPLLTSMADKLNLTLYDPSDAKEWPEFVRSRSIKPNQVLVESATPGAAFLLVVRETFTHPLIVILYTILVISATFHAYNGLWTSMIKWGILTTHAMQNRVRKWSYALMLVATFLGLMAAWGSYLL